MKLSEVKNTLSNLEELKFELPSGETLPIHFHVTEVGAINKKFIDCGGVMREEVKIGFQLWEGPDRGHRLAASKLRDIIQLSQEKLQLPDAEVEVEYQGATIEKYGLTFENGQFQLVGTQTECLAMDLCTTPKPKFNLKEVGGTAENSCAPGSGCC